MDISLWSKFLDGMALLRQKTGEIAADLFDFFYFRLYLIIIFGLLALNWLIFYIFRVETGDGLVILHYNVDFGVNFIGTASQAYALPLIGLIIAILNLILTFIFYNLDNRRAELIIHFLLLGAVLANASLTNSLLAIWLVNF